MRPTAPVVALLFDDVELGSQLREALSEHGARIVYEGAVSSLTRELLEKVGADVLVVNLDDVADDALDNLYEAIDGTSRKIVFNDGHASRALTGWDRARWARHLALKVFEVGEIDPPRPESARGVDSPDRPLTVDVEMPAAELAGHDLDGLGESRSDGARFTFTSVNSTSSADTMNARASGPAAASLSAVSVDTPRSDLLTAHRQDAGTPHADLDRADGTYDAAATAPSTTSVVTEVDSAELSWSVESTPAPAERIKMEMADSFSLDDLPDSFEGADDLHGNTAREESESLAAELEALLASADLATDGELPSGSGLKFNSDDEPPMPHDDHLGLPRSDREPAEYDDPFAIDLEAAFNEKATSLSDEELRPSTLTPTKFPVDHLGPTLLLDAVTTTVHAPPSASVSAGATRASVGASSSWSLIEGGVAPAATPEKASPSEFGIEKISATDFLAPDTDNADEYSELLMSFDRMSMEEAIAPRPYEDVSGTHFGDASGTLGRVVLLGAAASGADSVCDFLAAIPADTPLFFLHTQHLGDMSVEAMVAKLAIHSSLSVRLATQGSRATAGEVLVVPLGQQLRLGRDGSIDLQPSDSHAAKEPSIDATLSMAAGVFMGDALAIVFAGRGNDGVAGSQAVHDRGGNVWVEASPGEHPSDMVSGIVAERLASFSGSPHQLAAHLIEVYA